MGTLTVKALAYVEWISRPARRELLSLLHDEVAKECEAESREAKSKSKAHPRPNVNVIVGSKIRVSEIAVVQMLKGEYACSNETLRKIIDAAHGYAPEKTKTIIAKDLEKAQTKIQAAIESLRNNGNS